MSLRSRRTRVSHDRWLVSYADFVTLLFAFFVVLYAFAKSDQRRQIQVAEAIQEGFRSLDVASMISRNAITVGPSRGTIASSPKTEVLMKQEFVSPDQVRDDLERLRKDLEQRLSAQIQRRVVAVSMGRDGLVISLREAGFFVSGSAIPQPGTVSTLREIANSIRQTPYAIRVEGHTDNAPIHNDTFDSNWELSAARSTHIAHLLLDMHGIAPDRISASGYAEYLPIADNSTPEGRAKNRRVDLIITPRVGFDFSPRPSHSPDGPWKKITDNRCWRHRLTLTR